LTIDGKKQDAVHWKKDRVLHHPTWGIDVPACRVQGHSPTFGSITLFFFQQSTTRSSYWMHFRQVSMRGAEIWHIWKQLHLLEGFWKMLKAILHIRARPLQGNGLYTAWLIKVFASLLALRLPAHRPFSTLTITQIMRKLSRDHDVKDVLTTHFHVAFLTT
jgi:hypothetical protein